MKKILVLLPVVFMVSILFLLPEDAHAATFTAAKSGPWNVGSTWVGGKVPSSSDDKIIPAGINVTVTTQVQTSGNITNSGTITISNTGAGSIGITSNGTIHNHGTITISNVGNGAVGLLNLHGTLDNMIGGQITISNTGTNSRGIYNGGILTNSGNITISNFGSLDPRGIQNRGSITNFGNITISNTGGYGIRSIGAHIFNYGNITISGSGSYGILSQRGSMNSTIINHSGAVITISNSEGIENRGSIVTNDKGGKIFVSNTGGTGIVNGLGLMTNAGTFTIKSRSTGLLNEGTFNNTSLMEVNNAQGNPGIINIYGNIINSGKILMFCDAYYYGTPVMGNPLIDLCHPTSIAIVSPASMGQLKTITLVGKVYDTNAGKRTAPMGTISWDDGFGHGGFAVNGTAGNTCTLSPINSSASSCKVTYTTNANFPVDSTINISARYSGEPVHHSNFALTQVKVLRPTAISIAPASASITHGTKQLLNATVTDSSPFNYNRISPNGTVTWKASLAGGSFSSMTCTLAPISPTKSSCTVIYTAPLAVGTDKITAMYGGDSKHITSTNISKLTIT